MQSPSEIELTAVVVCRNDEEVVGHQIRRLHAHLQSLGIAAEIDHGLPCRHHTGCAADLAVEIGRALRSELSRQLPRASHRTRRDRCDGHPHRRSRVVQSRGTCHP